MEYAMTALRWGALYRVWYAPLFLLAAGLLVGSYLLYKKRLQLLVHHINTRLLLPGYTGYRSAVRLSLQMIALVALFIALLQPQWGKKDVMVVQEGRDILILLDISRSMQAQDTKPNRLAFVKLKIRKLLQKLSFERVGLILFSGSAFVQCPLTADYKTFLMYLDHVTTESISSGTTAIGTAINRAVEVFNRSVKRKNKIALLITDGEDFASDTDKLARSINKEGVTLFAWGVGSEAGAPVPIIDRYGKHVGNEKDASGKIALTSLNEPLLKKISSDLRGHYERVTQDDGDVSRIVAQLNRFETERFEERALSEYHDRYPIALFIAWVALLVEWIL